MAQGDGSDGGESLEAAVKGIAMGLTGKLKEAAGELLEDEQLERDGAEQQREADSRRSGTTG
ncbi:MAG TPA: hypothetical protein VEG38_20985 [Acidimicrobiia bacterium]|nr:hypothetical protein [Acidimicrobiia bacterium]